MSQVADLKSTLNLPKTDFPMKANLPQAEPKRIAAWKESDLYGRIRRTPTATSTSARRSTRS
jgi:isoleucyl-tRNA synthetase